MRAEEVKKGFPPGIQPPPDLVRLCEYSEQIDDFVVCDFELTDAGREMLLAGYEEHEDLVDRFAIFGRDGMHSHYGWWRCDDRPLEQAPIVFFSGEGVGTSVLAADFREFLSLLALGKTAIGMVDEWDPGECGNTARFREWLRAEFGLGPPEDGLALVERARAARPDLQSWLDDWIVKGPQV